MKKIFLMLLLLLSFVDADISDTIKGQCEKIIDGKENYEVPIDSYINGAVTGVLTAVDKRYHRSQIVAKRDKIMILACKEAFANKNYDFESAFVRGVQVTVDRRWSRFRKAK